MKSTKQSDLLKHGDVFILSKGTKVYHRTKHFQGMEVRNYGTTQTLGNR